MTSSSSLLWESMREEVARLKPEYDIEVRGPIAGGLSGASVFLVNFRLQGEYQLGVIKLLAAAKAGEELRGFEGARASWMRPYLPDYFAKLGVLPTPDGRTVLLASVAKGRLDNCLMLSAALEDSVRYAREGVLPAIALAYANEAKLSWGSSSMQPVRKCFQDPIATGLPHGWVQKWQTLGMPGPDSPALTFEELPERWPNPVAFFANNDLWPSDSTFQTRVPWLQSHGDLNPQNVLCPSSTRAMALGVGIGTSDSHKMLEHISLIDMPFCRKLPFTFDMAFLGSWLRQRLLPDFSTRINRDIVLKSYDAVLMEIETERKSEVPHQGEHFALSMSTIWLQLVQAQRYLTQDIKSAYLATIAAASLWQAAKVAPKDRREAVSALCFSAKALERLLAPNRRQLPKPDFELWTDTARSTVKWTAAAKEIGGLVAGLSKRKSLILALGSDWGRNLLLPSEDRLPDLKKQPPAQIVALLQQEPAREQIEALTALGRLPLLAVFDTSPFRYPRLAIEVGLPPTEILRPYHIGDTEPDWNSSDAVYYFYTRGSFEKVSTVSLTGPERNKIRRDLRPVIEHLRDNRAGDLTVLYVGATEVELKELSAYFHDVWGDSICSVYIGASTPSIADHLHEWGIRSINGGPQDFLAACSDIKPMLIAPSVAAPTVGRWAVRVADVKRDADGSLIAAPDAVLSIPIPDEDARAICRAGQLLCEYDFVLFDNPTRPPKDFFVGYRVELSEIHHGVPVERRQFAEYLNEACDRMDDKHPQVLVIPSRPGAGASTALRWLAYHLAFKRNIPTMILKHGGNVAFEAIERIQRLIGRSFVVIADPQDVANDELGALYTRCAPSRYPVLFLTSIRANATRDDRKPSILPIELDQREIILFLERLSKYYPSVDITALQRSRTRSLFLLTLEAFGGANVRVSSFVASLLQQANERQTFLVVTVALFSHYAHRVCSDDFLQVLVNCPLNEIGSDFEIFDQLLVLREGAGWTVRHDQLSRCVLEQHLTTLEDAGISYRHYLADFVVKVIQQFAPDRPGYDIAADYVWALLNPHVGAERSNSSQSRLLSSEDGIPVNAMRDRVFRTAAEAFPRNVNILSHYGKFLSEEEQKWPDAERYLVQAHELEPGNKAVLHMLGKRYFDEVKETLKSNPAGTRTTEVKDRILAIETAAHSWFDKARELDLGSEYNYTTPIQLDIALIKDEFKRLGVRHDPQVRSAALVQERIAALLSHAHGLVAEGLRYIEPREQSRWMFNEIRDDLNALHGDLATAIQCYRAHVNKHTGRYGFAAKIQLARFLHELAEQQWINGNRAKAKNGFEEAEKCLFELLQDPAHRYSNIKFWFDCARYLGTWTRTDFLERLHQLHDRAANTLDAAFLLMCLYFAEAVQTGSPESWRRCQEFERKSAQRSSNLAVRRYLREWLVEVSVKDSMEYRVFPNYLFESAGARIDAQVDFANARPFSDNRVKLTGVVSRIDSATAGYIKIEPTSFELFFQPRVKERPPFYKSDEGRSRVTFLVAFTYEKPLAFDVQRIEHG